MKLKIERTKTNIALGLNFLLEQQWRVAPPCLTPFVCWLLTAVAVELKRLLMLAALTGRVRPINTLCPQFLRAPLFAFHSSVIHTDILSVY